MPTARTRANRRYNEKAYDRLAITVPKGRLADIKAEAERRGVKVNGLVNDLLMDCLGIDASAWPRRKTAPGD